MLSTIPVASSPTFKVTSSLWFLTHCSYHARTEERATRYLTTCRARTYLPVLGIQPNRGDSDQDISRTGLSTVPVSYKYHGTWGWLDCETRNLRDINFSSMCPSSSCISTNVSGGLHLREYLDAVMAANQCLSVYSRLFIYISSPCNVIFAGLPIV